MLNLLMRLFTKRGKTPRLTAAQAIVLAQNAGNDSPLKLHFLTATSEEQNGRLFWTIRYGEHGAYLDIVICDESGLVYKIKQWWDRCFRIRIVKSRFGRG